MSPNAGGWGGGGCGVSANEYSCTHGAQINFEDVTPCLTYGTNKVKKCAVRKIIFCTWPTKAAKAGPKIYCTGTTSPTAGPKIYCTGTTSPTNQPRKGPFHMYSKSPIYLSFNSQQGPLLSSPSVLYGTIEKNIEPNLFNYPVLVSLNSINTVYIPSATAIFNQSTYRQNG